MRQLGRSGLEVAPLAFGGNVFGWTADESTSFKLLDAFTGAGFNLIDTANNYSYWVPGNSGGESETLIGRWLRQRPGMRAKVLIATKVGASMGPGRAGLSKAHIVEQAERSLKRLSTDHIDLYQSHGDDTKTPLNETLEAYTQLRRQGKVRVIGASNFTAPRIVAALKISTAHEYPRYECVQPKYNLFDREKFEGALADLCRDEGLGVISHSSLAGGLLTGKYRSEADLRAKTRGQMMNKLFTAKSIFDERGRKILAALDQVSQETGATPAQISLAWLLAHGVTAPIASATTLEQLDELMKGVRLELPGSAIALLDDTSATHQKS